ncbi:MAG: hypothetical protein ACE5FY_03475 [Nitrospiria bacterium]
MLQDKRFIAILVILLIVVAINNFKYFFMKEDVGFTEIDQISELPREKQISKRIEVANISPRKPEKPKDMNNAPAASIHSSGDHDSKFPEIELSSVDGLTSERKPFLMNSDARNPFLTKKEEDRFRKRPNKRKKKSPTSRQVKVTSSQNMITAKMIKLIYIGEETSYALIHGETLKEGDRIGDDEILSIKEDRLVLKRLGKAREVVIDNAQIKTGKKDHQIEIHYE